MTSRSWGRSGEPGGVFDLSAACDAVLVRGEFPESHGAAGVQFVGADADFCAEAVFFSVAEAGGAVVIDACAVHAVLEGIGMLGVFGDDGIAVVRAVAVDVVDGFLQAADGFDGEDEIFVFGAPVFFGSREEPGMRGRLSAQARISTPRAASRAAMRGRKSAAMLRWTRRVSMALQTPGRWVLASSAMSMALAKSAVSST